MAEVESAEALFKDCLHDLWAGEDLQAPVLDELAGSVADGTLRDLLRDHARCTRDQAARLQALAGRFGFSAADGPENLWMSGMAEDARRDTRSVAPGPLLDAALIGAVRKMEAAETVSYETAVACALMLGRSEAAATLSAIRAEEVETDARLGRLLGVVLTPG